MVSVKLSQIAQSSNNMGPSDTLVGVSLGPTDVRFTAAQIAVGIGAPLNVFNFGAKGDGVADDTIAFQAALNQAGTRGYVIAPAGFTYKLSGVVITQAFAQLDVWGSIVVPPGSGSVITSAIIIDGGGVNAARVNIYGTIMGQEQITRPNSSNHFCAGVTLGFALNCQIFINYAAYLYEVAALRPGRNVAPLSRTPDCTININFAEKNTHTVHGVGGSTSNNHTQGTILQGAFWTQYVYGIRKENTTGDQSYWYATGISIDGFPGSNPDFIADIEDHYGDNKYDLAYASAPSGTFIGAGFMNPIFGNDVRVGNNPGGSLNYISNPTLSSQNFLQARNAANGGFLALLGTSGSDDVFVGLGTVTTVLFWPVGNIISIGNNVPNADNTYTSGANGKRWSAVWAANGTIQTSDARVKADIKELPGDAISIVNQIKPRTYRFIEGGKEVEPESVKEAQKAKDSNKLRYRSREGKRTHWGFLANEVKAAVAKTGLDFGGYVKGEDGVEGLRYDQLVPILWKAVQELSAKVDELSRK